MTSASIWNPQGTAQTTVNADSTLFTQSFIATAQQTVFNLTLFAYTPATHSLLIAINGVDQVLTDDYLETSATAVTLTTGCEVGDKVVIRGFIGSTASATASVSAGQAAASATASAASAAAALAIYNSIIALSLPNLPLTVANGGTGVATTLAAIDVLSADNGAVVASAATVNLDTATGRYVHISGNAVINAFTIAAGKDRILVFNGTPTLTNSASIINPTGANITVEAGDIVYIRAEAANTVRICLYQRASGYPLTYVGKGGATNTSNVTLTSVSSSAQSLAATTLGQGYTLPDATTCVKGSIQFTLSNTGDMDVFVKDSTGVTRTFIRAHSTVLVALADNSTAAGGWTFNGGALLGVTAQFINTTIANMAVVSSTNVFMRIAIDANRTLFIFGGTDLYGIMYDASSLTWGSATLLRSGISAGSFNALLSAANQVLLVSCDTTTGYQAVTLTLSGTAITVNTPVAVVLAGNIVASTNMPLIATGAQFAAGYLRAATNNYVRAITIAGTIPTIGAESAALPGSTGAAILFAIDASHFLTFSFNGTTLFSLPYSFAGTVLTAGTQSSSAGIASGYTRFAALGSGRWAAVSTISGTTITQGTIISVNTGTNTSTQTIVTVVNAAWAQTVFDAVVLSATKVLAVSGTGGASGACSFNILTDSAGTAVAGTAVTVGTGGTWTNAVIVSVSGTTARVALYASGGAGSATQVTLDCSGASPVISRVDSMFTNESVVPVSEVVGSVPTGMGRSPSFVMSGNNAITIPQQNAVESFNFNANALVVSTDKLPIAGRFPAAAHPAQWGAAGATTESWLAGVWSNNQTTGYTINRVEAATP